MAIDEYQSNKHLAEAKAIAKAEAKKMKAKKAKAVKSCETGI